ncbi:MAG TPA: CHAP domain-containing protein [Candidatus Nitrosotenuis sp.]|nr:CHAP domain-containing protein [Candidatus Nitrosotenuis sp.]
MKAFEEAYRRDTGWSLHRLNNKFSVGQCTWFVNAALEDEIPWRGHAGTWWDTAQKDEYRSLGYGTGSEPREGAICVWQKVAPYTDDEGNVVGYYGHVALVSSKERPDGSFEVWDCNWSPDLDGKIRHRLIKKRDKIVGFIYPPSRKAEVEILVEETLHHLGDNRFNTPINVGFVKQAEGVQWWKAFRLSSNLAERHDGWVVVNMRGAESSVLYINGRHVGNLHNVPEDNGEAQAFPILPGTLRTGENRVQIVSGFNPADPTDNDDLEFHDVTVFFGDIQRHVRR